MVSTPQTWWAIGSLAVAVGVAFAVRKRLPVTSVVVAMAAAALYFPLLAPVPFLSYAAGRRFVRWWHAAVGFVLIMAGTPLLLWANRPSDGFHPDLSLQLLIVVALPALAGRYRRQRAELETQAREQTRRWEREHDLLLDRARNRERSRIAEQMHDLLGHDLSLIALQAGALATDSSLSEAQRARATLLGRLTGEATDRLHEIVELLAPESSGRSEAPSDAPTNDPSTDLAIVVDRANAAGTEVRVVRDGNLGAAPAFVRRTVAEIVRESVTNATRHAPGVPVLVRLLPRPDHLEFEVINRVPEELPTVASSGRGLAGLGARVRLVGGRLDWGPIEGGAGFAVSASLPYASPACRDASASDREAGRWSLDAVSIATRQRMSTAFWKTVAVPGLAFVTVIATYSLYAVREIG